MFIHEVYTSKCDICFGSNQQYRFILKRLQQKLLRVLTNSQQYSKQEKLNPQMDGFLQLLRVLRLRQSLKDKKYDQCKHFKLFKSLQKSLKCNFDTLDSLCEITANILAQKNYTLELLELQFKNIGERVGKKDVVRKSIFLKAEGEERRTLASLPADPEMRMDGPRLGYVGWSQTSIDEVIMDFNNGLNNEEHRLPPSQQKKQ